MALAVMRPVTPPLKSPALRANINSSAGGKGAARALIGTNAAVWVYVPGRALCLPAWVELHHSDPNLFL